MLRSVRREARSARLADDHLVLGVVRELAKGHRGLRVDIACPAARHILLVGTCAEPAAVGGAWYVENLKLHGESWGDAERERGRRGMDGEGQEREG